MGPLEYFIGCTIKHDLTKIILKISQPHLRKKMNQGFNNYMKSHMYFNTLTTQHKGIVMYAPRNVCVG